jgi:ABC-type multidrug transport system fused ATPase/permease subunit
MKGKTVIAIPHRLITIRDADRIVAVTGGVVAESGTHDELIAATASTQNFTAHSSTPVQIELSQQPRPINAQRSKVSVN